LSHPAVIKITGSMIKKGLLESLKDKNDGRKHLVNLSEYGKSMLSTLETIWDSFETVIYDLFEETGYDIIDVIGKTEEALDKKGMVERINCLRKSRLLDSVNIIEYSEKYKDYFKSLNFEWLKRYFELEDMDKKILTNPEEEIIDKGGFIFFAEIGSKIIGTCALMKINKKTYELTKMSVTENAKGKQAGRKLAQKVIKKAKEIGASEIILYTDKRLIAAVNLYRDLGFIVTKSDSKTSFAYRRESSGFMMILKL